MEQFIILLIWLGMGLFGLIAKARNKKQQGQAPGPRADDWLDEQWQELVQTQDREPPRQQNQPKSTPPELPPREATAQAPQATWRERLEMEEMPAVANVAPPPLPPKMPALAQPLLSAPTSSYAVNTIAPPNNLQESEIGAPKKRRGGRNRHSSVTELLQGRNSLRRAMLLREIIDRPRAYDV